MASSFIKNNRVLSHFTPRLGAAVGLIALSTFNYGFDNQGIATGQAMTAYKRQFGVFDPGTNTYAISTYWTSLLNSLNFIGFAVGRCLLLVIYAKVSLAHAYRKDSILAVSSAHDMDAESPCSACPSGR